MLFAVCQRRASAVAGLGTWYVRDVYRSVTHTLLANSVGGLGGGNGTRGLGLRRLLRTLHIRAEGGLRTTPKQVRRLGFKILEGAGGRGGPGGVGYRLYVRITRLLGQWLRARAAAVVRMLR